MGYSAHREAKTPPDDTVIWRYMDLPKFLALLEQSALYFPVLSELPDKWEAVIDRTFAGSVASTLGASASGDYIATMQAFIRTAAVNCWYIGDEESIAMWTLYTSTIYGIAIRSTVARLKQAVTATEELVYLGTVEYRDHEDVATALYPPEGLNAIKAFLQKRVCYKHECELRAFSFIQPRLPRSGTPGQVVHFPLPNHGTLIKIHLADLIESITLGPGFPAWAHGILVTALSRAKISPPINNSDAYRLPPSSVIEP